MNNTIQNLKGILLGLLIVVGISYAQAAWNAPTAHPTGDNTDAPINVSAVGQSKSGGLILNTGGAQDGLIVQSGDVGIGTSNPSEKVDVAGNIKASGTICDVNGCIGSGGGGESLGGLSCSTNQIAKWNGSMWVCATDNDTGILVGGGNNSYDGNGGGHCNSWGGASCAGLNVTCPSGSSRIAPHSYSSNSNSTFSLYFCIK